MKCQYLSIMGEVKNAWSTLVVPQNKKRQHSFHKLQAFCDQHLSEYETSDSDLKVN